jgi:hypothetical protein
MILEGFEIDNWSCIKHVAVTDLRSTGIIVLHGPNGTGKSSIVEALRACLMDNKSTSKALDRGFPKNSTEKPRVSVTFRTAGTSWRITKQFNSKDSKLESRTTTGQWKLETADPSEAHERTRRLTGGSDSTMGLHQLLWLTQAEFRLPDPKKFDADVQSRLRAVLGVLQTPLDDRFLARVKEQWTRWFSVRSKPGETPKLKKDCSLDKDLQLLNKHREELARIEVEFANFEKMLEDSGSLEVRSRDLRRQLAEKTQTRDLLQDEYEKSLKRLEAHRLAAEHVAQSEKALADAQALGQRRADAEERMRQAQEFAAAAGRDVDDESRRLCAAEQSLRELRSATHSLRDTARDLQARLNEVNHRRKLLTLNEQFKAAREYLRRTEQAAGELEALKKQARERPAPEGAVLQKLEENRATATRLRADLEAAALALTLVPQPGAAIPALGIDGAPGADVTLPNDGSPIRRSVRRRAEITIPGWGSVELTRGSDARSLDQIENDLKQLDHQFAEVLAPFGVAAGDASALDQLRGLAAEKKVRDPELQRKRHELERLAPHGLDPLRQEVARLEKLLLSAEPPSPTLLAGLPSDAAALEELAARIQNEVNANEKNIAAAQQQIEAREREIHDLRRQETCAKEKLAAFNATAAGIGKELDRMPTAEKIERAIRDAAAGLPRAHAERNAAQLSASEETIRERLAAANEGCRALQDQLTEANKEFHQIEGELRHAEGLHPKRAAAAARVDELLRRTQRETLESQAYDRLYALFEECRERQLGTVMKPIHQQVMRWMRLLRIGDYQEIRFNDQFLPDKLIAGGGATELLLQEESVGTIEQIALMVRLALGATLSTADEPVVAMLDDPLTHSDVVRLDRMRAVLKNASLGDAGSTPPAGPLQIVIFTCHPEWFAIDGAKVVDLSRADVLTRSC